MKKNGFTLVELLAVLIILGVVTVIAVPAISKTLERSRQRAKEAVIKELEQAATKYVAENIKQFTTEKCLSVEKLVSTSYIKNDEVIDPTTETIMTGAILIIPSNNDYKIYYDENEPCISGDVSIENSFQDGSIVYFNPTTNQKCKQTESNSVTGTKNGCMKWYTFSNESNNSLINLLLDHNTTSVIRWSSTDTNSTNADFITSQLLLDTSGWSSTLRSNARLITIEEVAKITKITFNTNSTLWNQWVYLDSNSQIQQSNASSLSKYSWLFDYTKSCKNYGCKIEDSSTSGYWSSTKVFNRNYAVWGIYSEGRISDLSVSNSEKYGIRPVITLSKSSLK